MTSHIRRLWHRETSDISLKGEEGGSPAAYSGCGARRDAHLTVESSACVTLKRYVSHVSCLYMI